MQNSFREALGRHLLAIEERDLDALADTVDDDEILLVMSDGKLVRSKKEFLEAHRGWFGQVGDGARPEHAGALTCSGQAHSSLTPPALTTFDQSSCSCLMSAASSCGLPPTAMQPCASRPSFISGVLRIAATSR